MDTTTRKIIEDTIVRSLSNSGIVVTDACIVIEEYIYEKKNERLKINEFITNHVQGDAFNFYLQYAIAYFKHKFSFMTIVNKNREIVSLRFNS